MSYGAVDYLVILCLPQTCQCVRIMFACVCGCLGWGGCCVSVQDQAHHVTLSDLKFSANFSGARNVCPSPTGTIPTFFCIQHHVAKCARQEW